MPAENRVGSKYLLIDWLYEVMFIIWQKMKFYIFKSHIPYLLGIYSKSEIFKWCAKAQWCAKRTFKTCNT